MKQYQSSRDANQALFDMPLGNAPQTRTATVTQEPKPIDLAAMVKALAEAVPQEYMLIDPQGRVFKGPNPMVLAAQAMPQMAIQDISRDPPFQF